MPTTGMRWMLCLLATSALTAVGIEPLSAGAAAGPMLGEPAAREVIAAWDFTVTPDGAGLPAGQGSVAEGEALYAARCAACHGPAGEGGSADRLAGAEAALTGEWPEKTVGNYWPYATTLLDFIRRAMPMTAPGTLSDHDSYALVAYLLYLNGIVAADAVLDRDSLLQVQMPNRAGFIPVMQ